MENKINTDPDDMFDYSPYQIYSQVPTSQMDIRTELAARMTAAVASSLSEFGVPAEEICKRGIQIADELIKQLNDGPINK